MFSCAHVSKAVTPLHQLRCCCQCITSESTNEAKHLKADWESTISVDCRNMQQSVAENRLSRCAAWVTRVKISEVVILLTQLFTDKLSNREGEPSVTSHVWLDAAKHEMIKEISLHADGCRFCLTEYKKVTRGQQLLTLPSAPPVMPLLHQLFAEASCVLI